MSEIIVEVDVVDGLPGTMWTIKQDPRYLLAVVHKLKEYQRHGTPIATGADKFVARWLEGGYVEIEVPAIDGDHKAFLFVLTQTLESIAKIKIEMEWGRKFLGQMMAQPQIARPNPPRGQLVL